MATPKMDKHENEENKTVCTNEEVFSVEPV